LSAVAKAGSADINSAVSFYRFQTTACLRDNIVEL
jgi:hypothetical protein